MIASSLLLFPLAYIAFTLLLFALSTVIPILAFYARLLASYLALAVCAAYGVVVSVLLRLAGCGQISQWATGRCFKWVMGLTTGVRFVVVDGQEHLRCRPAVFVSNHQTVTAKKSLRKVPILGWFMSISKTVFIDRTNRQTAVAAFDGAAAVMRRDKQSVFIFAEGTRSYYREPDLLPFKKGAFHLAIQAQVPVVPIVVANYSHILDTQKKRFRAGSIPVTVLPPLPTVHLTPADVDDLTQRTRDVMLVEVKRLTAIARADAAAATTTTMARDDDADEEDSIVKVAGRAAAVGNGHHRMNRA
ncbi:MAG: 1-acylglycerol-3-phosphate O-acyltransferase [Phylliscum demangeonii]|nr:MAG: 1-acylglycerol-3-phosphate O-acyltransferase [Phylliscum demangeonii]